MRSDNYMGLNEWASRLVNRKTTVREHGVQVFSGGRVKQFSRRRKVRVLRRETAGVIRGAWKDQVAPLYRYTMPDGRVLVEYVQACPWSGGPCYFVALKDKNGVPVAESLWTEEQLAGF